jgi:hypothetical protein
MPTKKVDDAKLDQKLERGRFAERLDAGFVIEIEPSKKRTVSSTVTRKPKPTAPKA